MRHKILFLRHADAVRTSLFGDIGRTLSRKGLRRLQATAAALKGENFQRVITSGTVQTLLTGYGIATEHPEVKEIESCTSFYLPLDPQLTARFSAAFEKLVTPRNCYGHDGIRTHYGRVASTILASLEHPLAPKALVMSHDVVIQIMTVSLRLDFMDVLDLKLGPCDGIWVTTEDRLARSYEVFRAPKII